jgi:hypothetical protein
MSLFLLSWCLVRPFPDWAELNKTYFNAIYPIAGLTLAETLRIFYTNDGAIGLYHPLDGITNPKYKLLHSLTANFFLKREEGTTF